MTNQLKTRNPKLFKLAFIIPLALVFVFSRTLLAEVTTPSIENRVPQTTSGTLKQQTLQNTEDSIYSEIEQAPQFSGGEEAKLEFLKQNIRYPAEAQKKHEQGKVIVQFVVGKTGQIRNAKVVRKVSPSLDLEALRVVNSFPNWIPAVMNGLNVATYSFMPITFKDMPAIDKDPVWEANDKTIIIIDSLRMPANFNLDILNSKLIDTILVLKPVPEEAKAKLIARYGALAENGVILILSKNNGLPFNLSDSLINPSKYGIAGCKEPATVPEYPGGETKLLKYIGRNLKYPVAAQKLGITGKVIVRFIVAKTGKVRDARVIKSVDPLLDKEALRVINTLSDFTPSEQCGEKARAYLTLPITFDSNFSKKNKKGWAKNDKTIILLDGERLPSSFDLNLLNYENLSSYKTFKPTNKAISTQLVAIYGVDAVNGVIDIRSILRNQQSKTDTVGIRDSFGNKVYDVVDKMPQFPGGEEELMKFIGENLKYPVISQENGVHGKVILRFIVNTVGNVENVEVYIGIDPLLNKEAFRVVNLLPEFIPGELNGIKTPVYYTLPITFSIR